MKQLLKNIFIVGTIGLAVAIIATQAHAAFVPTNNSNPEPLKFLDVSSTNQSKQGWLGLGSPGTYNPLAVLDVKNTTFTDALSVIGKAWFSGNVLVGYSSIPNPITNKLMVDQGYIRSTALTGTGDRPACSDANGKFIPCANAGGSTAVPQVVSTSPLCGSAANTFATGIPTQNLCNTTQSAQILGSVTPTTNGAYSWSCYTYNGNFVTATCATSPLPPICGGAAYIATTTTPDPKDRCFAGTSSTPTLGSNGVYTWTCTDTFGNPPATCTTPVNNTTPTRPTDCFGLNTVNGLVLTCAQGSATATRYEAQAYLPGGTWGEPTNYTSSPVTKQSTETLASNAGLGSWAGNLVQLLPHAMFLTGVQDPGDTSAYTWRIRACNGVNNCSNYSEYVYPRTFYGADQYGVYNASPFTPVITVDQQNHLVFTWNKMLNEPTSQSVYPMVYIHHCASHLCTASGGYNTGSNALEMVDPTTIASTAVTHGPMSCNATTCSVTTTATTFDPNTDGFMVTLGKDLYNDARTGPSQKSADPALTGYISSWDQFSPWVVAGF